MENQIEILKSLFLESLRENYSLYKLRKFSDLDFMGSLEKKNPLFWNYYKITDLSLNSALNFADFFFDAVYHCFTDVEGIPINEAEKLIENVIKAFENNEVIQDKRILDFYYYKGD